MFTSETAEKGAMEILTATEIKLKIELVSVNQKLVKAFKIIMGLLNNLQKKETMPKKGPHYCCTCGRGVWCVGRNCWDKKTNTKTKPPNKIKLEVQKILGRAGKHDVSSVLFITEMITVIISTVCPHNRKLY